MQVSARISFPEKEPHKWYYLVKEYRSLEYIEVAFYNPYSFLENVEPAGIVKPLKEFKMKVSSVHFPQFNLIKKDLFKPIFTATTDILRKLNSHLLIIHPCKGRIEQIEGFINSEINPVLEKEKIYLCWETFESKKRLFGGLENIFKYCKDKQFHGICYDFSHIHKREKEVLDELNQHIELIKVFHLSNKLKNRMGQHYPIFYRKEEVVFNFRDILLILKERDYKGYLVLEYLPQFSSQLLPDIEKIVSFL